MITFRKFKITRECTLNCMTERDNEALLLLQIFFLISEVKIMTKLSKLIKYILHIIMTTKSVCYITEVSFVIKSTVVIDTPSTEYHILLTTWTTSGVIRTTWSSCFKFEFQRLGLSGYGSGTRAQGLTYQQNSSLQPVYIYVVGVGAQACRTCACSRRKRNHSNLELNLSFGKCIFGSVWVWHIHENLCSSWCVCRVAAVKRLQVLDDNLNWFVLSCLSWSVTLSHDYFYYYYHFRVIDRAWLTEMYSLARKTLVLKLLQSFIFGFLQFYSLKYLFVMPGLANRTRRVF